MEFLFGFPFRCFHKSIFKTTQKRKDLMWLSSQRYNLKSLQRGVIVVKEVEMESLRQEAFL